MLSKYNSCVFILFAISITLNSSLFYYVHFRESACMNASLSLGSYAEQQLAGFQDSNSNQQQQQQQQGEDQQYLNRKVIQQYGQFPPPFDFSFYVLELPEEFTKEQHGWVDPLHTAFLSSPFRTMNAEQADLFLVPYYQFQIWSFSNGTRPRKDSFIHKFEVSLLEWMHKLPEWKMYNGVDFVFWSDEINPFLADHYMYINSVQFWKTGPISMLCEIPAPANYSEAILFQRQIVIPYREANPLFISEPYWSASPTKKYLIQFCGSKSRYEHGKWVRREIVRHLNAEAPDVSVFTYFEGGFEKNETIMNFLVHNLSHIMRESTFCIAPYGDTPGARRMFDAILAKCIPVIIADDVRVPFYGLVNYSEFSIKIPEDQISNLETTLRDIPQKRIKEMMDKLLEIRPYFVWPNEKATDARMMTLLEHELSARARAMREHKHWVRLVTEHPQTQEFSTKFVMWDKNDQGF